MPSGHNVRANARRSARLPWKSPKTYAGDLSCKRRGSAERILPNEEMEMLRTHFLT